MNTVHIPENFDIEKAAACRDKLRGKYNRSGLSATDYNELLELDKAIDQILKKDAAIQYIQQNDLQKVGKILEAAPSNAESFQNGYYFRTKPEFQFHNGFHPVWNLTDNNGEYFKKRGFHPVDLNELECLVESVDMINELGGLESAKANLREMYSDSSCDWVHESARLYDYKHLTVGRVKQAIAEYEEIYSGAEQ